MTVVVNSILPRQEAFLVDATTPTTSPLRWIQAKALGHALGDHWASPLTGHVGVTGEAPTMALKTSVPPEMLAWESESS